MRFTVIRMRDSGRVLPRHAVANDPGCSGDLRVEQVFDDQLRRYVRLARLLDPQRPIAADQLPALYDPVIMAMSPLAFTLSGFERVADVHYAQSWLVTRPP